MAQIHLQIGKATANVTNSISQTTQKTQTREIEVQEEEKRVNTTESGGGGEKRSNLKWLQLGHELP